MNLKIMFSKIRKIKIKIKLQEKYIKKIKIRKHKIKKCCLLTKKCSCFDEGEK